MKKLLAIFLSATMMFSLTACGKPTQTAEPTAQVMQEPTPAPEPTPTPEPEIVKIGVAMPTKSLQRWNQDGDNIKGKLENKGYMVDLQFADNEVSTQIKQIESMVTDGCKVLIIGAIDGEALAAVLASAKEKGIKVIAYDRLIMMSDAVTYYLTFDNLMIGTLHGQYIEETLGLKSGAGPFNIEFVTGDPGDSSWTPSDYAMKVLQPYIDSGKLVVPSGQISFEQTATANWSSENAKARFDNILSEYYSDGKKLDAVMASSDSLAQGVANALLAAGYTKDNFPIITGQDGDYVSLKYMLNGYQSMSIYKETRTLSAKAVEMADAIVKGTEVPVNDTKTFNNGTGIVDTYLCAPVVVTVDNYREYLMTNEPYYSDWWKLE